jgi:hypothetical protein
MNLLSSEFTPVISYAMKPEETSGLLILLINILFTFASSCFRSNLLIILLKGSKILASLGEFTLLQMSYSK